MPRVKVNDSCKLWAKKGQGVIPAQLLLSNHPAKLGGGLAVNCYHVSALLQLVQIVTPLLHHFPAFG